MSLVIYIYARKGMSGCNMQVCLNILDSEYYSISTDAEISAKNFDMTVNEYQPSLINCLYEAPNPAVSLNLSQLNKNVAFFEGFDSKLLSIYR